MKGLRNRFDRFCFRNRDKGIHNLMLYIAIGTLIVTIMYNLNYRQIYNVLCFSYSDILNGQVWRLFTYVFTLGVFDAHNSVILVFDVFSSLIMLYCFFSLGRAVEQAMGTLKFNLYYLSGILMMDLFGMLFGGFSYVQIGGEFIYIATDWSVLFSGNMAFFLYLSLILCFATLYPDAQFLLFYLIPIKAWLMALFYVAYILYAIISMALNGGFFPQCLFPLVGLANYFLFFGKEVLNLFPRYRTRRRVYRPSSTPNRRNTIHFSGEKPKKEAAPTYTHRCTVCGRTDVTNPELEFRYCSRCNGYFCYCEDHINNHTHVE